MNITEANHMVKLLRYLLEPDTKVTDEQSRAAAEFLASRSYRALLTGVTPDEALSMFDAFTKKST